jgi:hypothetical protein
VEKQDDKPKRKQIRVGQLDDLGKLAAFQRRIIRAMTRGSISVLDGHRILMGTRALMRTMEARDIEGAVSEAREILGQIKKLRNQ